MKAASVTPFLWFNNNVGEAVRFYKSIFKKTKIINMNKDGTTVISATINLNGQEFIAFNGGPMFKFSPAVSFFIECKNQKEVDHYWEKLGKGGEKQRCGWVEDKFGISWQVIPTSLGKLMGSKDREKADRVLEAMLQMKKIDIKKLEKAYRGK